MKHILNIMCLLAVVLLAAGCRDKGYDVSETPTFKILSADVSYTASGGSGTVEIELLKSATPKIEVSKDWCHATLSGNTINVTVDGNSESFSRESTLEITVDGYSRTVGIYQGGVFFYVDTEFDQELGYKKNDVLNIPLIRDGVMDLQVTDCSNWIEASVEGDAVIVKSLTDNGLIKRTGFITLKAGAQVKTIDLVQAAYPVGYSEYLGNWTMTYMSAANYGGEQLSLDLVFAVNEEGESFKMTGLGTYTVIFTYNSETGQLRFNVRDKIGTYTTGGVTYDATIGMFNVAGAVNASSTTLHWLSSYEIVDGKLVMRFIPSNASYSSGFGLGYINATGGWSSWTNRRYYADVVFYKK